LIKSHLIAIFFVIAILPSTAFAQSEIDKDPFSAGNQFDQKPLDEHEQDVEFINQLWTICIVLVISMLVARVAFKIIKKRMQTKEEPE
jgi:flagellar biosynthesis/type III secretory pathway M-ring protein FliF/YscJ|tara:strand:- start:1172 stop:1435 length:264 start_codon:yes stop_codon:yes gene_type:complete